MRKSNAHIYRHNRHALDVFKFLEWEHGRRRLVYVNDSNQKEWPLIKSLWNGFDDLLECGGTYVKLAAYQEGAGSAEESMYSVHQVWHIDPAEAGKFTRKTWREMNERYTAGVRSMEDPSFIRRMAWLSDEPVDLVHVGRLEDELKRKLSERRDQIDRMNGHAPLKWIMQRDALELMLAPRLDFDLAGEIAAMRAKRSAPMEE